MIEQHRGLSTLKEDSLSYSLYPASIIMECEKLVALLKDKVDQQEFLPLSMRQTFAKQNVTFRIPKTISECAAEATRIYNNTNEINSTIEIHRNNYDIPEHSHSLIIFVILIGCVSLISVIGNLCLAKVLYSKRFRLIQTDRIVLCLALSELCLVLIDTPAEIYRFLTYSFTQEWLCRFHTFFEALFSSCILFYHLLGAFDRFVYIHGHATSTISSWSKWCRRVSTKSGSIILLILPIICSLPLAICNSLHTNILHISSTNKNCIVQYTHGILMSLLISFYILPLLFSFFLHGKLIYFIRSRHTQLYLTKTAYLVPMKRNNTTESQLKKRLNKENLILNNQVLLPPKHSSDRHPFVIKNETIGSTTTTTTMSPIQSTPLNSNPNNSSNSSQSSRQSTTPSSASVTSPIILYKINSQANANANRTVLLLVLLLSFYVFCWAPHNIYTWYQGYQLTQSSLTGRTINNSTSSIDVNQTSTTWSVNNRHADLRRIIFINYSLYLLSMISMCFSFIFYFSLNKQARQEFSRFTGCICPQVNYSKNQKQRQKYPQKEQNKSRQLQYRIRYQNQYPYINERIKVSPPLLINERYNHIKRTNYPPNDTSKRTVFNYGCQIQCCP